MTYSPHDRLKDLVVRTETNKLVTDLVDFDRVQSLLLMILYRRRYVAQREQARMQHFGQPGTSNCSQPSTL